MGFVVSFIMEKGLKKVHAICIKSFPEAVRFDKRFFKNVFIQIIGNLTTAHASFLTKLYCSYFKIY